jgi:hypothetical protein
VNRQTRESFCELVIASGDAPIALDSFEEVFYPVTMPVERCGKWLSGNAVTATRNARVCSFNGCCLPEGRAIIGFVANEGRILHSVTPVTSVTAWPHGRCLSLKKSKSMARQTLKSLLPLLSSVQSLSYTHFER